MRIPCSDDVLAKGADRLSALRAQVDSGGKGSQVPGEAGRPSRKLVALRNDDPRVPELLGKVSDSSGAQVALPSSPCTIKVGTLRGVRSDVVLRRRAHLLENASGSASTFGLSKQVDHLATFISHNWSVSRVQKWLTLSFEYNFAPALLGGLFTCAIFTCLTSKGLLLVAVNTQSSVFSLQVEQPTTIYCGVFAFMVFHVLLLFSPDILPRRCVPHTQVFLDKACIHQEDEELKREGIESLGGFLYYSWHMVVLYSRVYTQKVWTVYEMACFLCVNPDSRLVWLPVKLPPVVLVGSALVWFTFIIRWILSLRSVEEATQVYGTWLSLGMLVLSAVALTSLFRKFARDTAHSVADLRQFSIRSAVCAVESDRAKVEANVVSLMQHLELVPPDCSRNDALTAFNKIVQEKMPRVVHASNGVAGIRFEYVFVIACSQFFRTFDDLSSEVLASASLQRLIATVIQEVTWSLAIVPLQVALCMRICRYRTELTGFKNFVFTFFVAVFCGGVAVFSLGSLMLLESRAFENVPAFVALCLAAFCLFAVTLFVYWRRPGKQYRRRIGVKAETMEDLAKAFARSTQYGERVS